MKDNFRERIKKWSACIAVVNCNGQKLHSTGIEKACIQSLIPCPHGSVQNVVCRYSKKRRWTPFIPSFEPWTNRPNGCAEQLSVESMALMLKGLAMLIETIEARGRTTQDGILNLSVNVGIADSDVAVVVQVTPLTPSGDVDEHGWPKGFFEHVPGSMPELQRAPQGQFENRLPLQ
ncbi:MAG: hypothetical protein HYZ00_02690 [Candidatus Hydrogenedentes bacterium]|nr:hypothetical protein [Candidatus Hydrogenedentota bacterium]